MILENDLITKTFSWNWNRNLKNFL